MCACYLLFFCCSFTSFKQYRLLSTYLTCTVQLCDGDHQSFIHTSQAAQDIVDRLKDEDLLRIHTKMGPCYDFDVDGIVCDPTGKQHIYTYEVIRAESEHF